MNSVTSYEIEEPLFRTLDYIPLVSTVSGIARAAFGILQVVIGVVVLPVQLCARVANYEHRYLINLGMSNIVRSTFAIFPITGNIALYFYDHSQFIKDDTQSIFGLKKRV